MNTPFNLPPGVCPGDLPGNERPARYERIVVAVDEHGVASAHMEPLDDPAGPLPRGPLQIDPESSMLAPMDRQEVLASLGGLPERPSKDRNHAPAGAAAILESGAATYRERNAVYTDNYKHFGHIMVGLFPHGVPPGLTAEDWNRVGLVMNVVAKMQRYAMNITRGGHRDSAHDAMVYAAMLEEVTDERDA